MSEMRFDRSGVLGEGIKELDRRQLCELASELCALIKSEADAKGYRGGIYPDNISLGDGGELIVGAARVSGWQGQELDFLAPELYWQGTPGPAADVYSIGMLLYYATAGSLPFADESEDAFLKRMSGASIVAAPAAGKKLKAIIEKATAFDAAERYSGVGELKLMLDACVRNPYLGGKPGEKAVFNKERGELSELELMMLSIIDTEGEHAAPSAEEAENAEDIVEAEEAEDIEKVENVEQAEDVGEQPEEAAAETPSELPDLILTDEQPQAAKIPDAEEELFKTPFEVQPDADAEPLWDTPFNGLFEERELPLESEEEPEPDMPEKGNIFASEELSKPEVITIAEEKNPELEPVAAKASEQAQTKRQAVAIPAVQYTKNLEREKQIAAEVRKRRSRRPTAVILVLCAALVMVAIVFNAMRQDIIDAQKARAAVVTSAPVASAPVAAEPDIVPDDGEAEPEAVATAEPNRESTAVSRYEVFVEDVSWTEARDKCNALGGHLVVIKDEAEFIKICQLAEENNISRVWVGAHRIEGAMVWETSEQVNYYNWDDGEPSYSDSSDDAIEDYMLLWYHRGWVYNDSRNDPAGEFPQWYSGTIGYVCEYYD